MSVRWLAILLLLLAGCRGAPTATTETPDPPWFEDITDTVGLRFTHDAGKPGNFFMPQIMGSGCALFDADGDGRLDIYLVQNAGPDSGVVNRLFRQEPDGRFTDVSAGSGLDVAGHGMGVAIGDVNSDGRPDVFVTEFGRSRLFLNQGACRFTDVTVPAAIDNPHWGTSAAFLDFDRDGWLDLVVVNYVDYDPSAPCGDAGGKRDYCHPNRFNGTAARLFRNLGPDPTGKVAVRFEDVSRRAGLAAVPCNGLGVTCADFTGDGLPDIFAANDAQANRLWVNRGDGTFAEEAVGRGLGFNALGNPQANMGIALADVNGDLLADLLVTHLTEETHTLWAQPERGRFRDLTANAGLTRTRWRGTGFGTVLADFDHDGAPDLAIVNGRVARSPTARSDEYWVRYAERNQLLRNDGTGRFVDLSARQPGLCGSPGLGRGLACGDIDGDGALDLLVTNAASPARLYRNVTSNRGHWLLVRAIDPARKRDAYGAGVKVTAAGRVRLGWVNPGQSYLSSHDSRVHFGLGESGRYEDLAVAWPDGTEEVFPGGEADRCIVVRKGEGRLGSNTGGRP